jgi:hypothetical protein
MIAIDGPSYDYLFVKAVADHKTPAEVISDMILTVAVCSGLTFLFPADVPLKGVFCPPEGGRFFRW